MVAVVGTLLFVGALAASGAVIWTSIAPQWQRIVQLATGHVEPGFAPLATLANAEQRIAIRRWAAQPVPAAIRRLRAAA
jgi:hypothetical protein